MLVTVNYVLLLRFTQQMYVKAACHTHGATVQRERLRGNTVHERAQVDFYYQCSGKPENHGRGFRGGTFKGIFTNMSARSRPGYYRLEVNKTLWEVAERYRDLKQVGTGAYGTVW